MRNLLGFLIRISPLLLFILLETVAVVLMVQRSKYHNYAIISTSNTVSGGLLDASDAVTSYFSLASANEQLSLENSQLKNEIEIMKERLCEYEDSAKVMAFRDSLLPDASALTHIPAIGQIWELCAVRAWQVLYPQCQSTTAWCFLS